MAVTLRAEADAFTGTLATLTATTNSTPQVGDLAVVVSCNDFITLADINTPTATGSPTMNAITGATWDGGTNEAHIKAWWYVVNTAGAQAATATYSGGAGNADRGVIVTVWAGADTTTAIDAAASAGSSSNGSPVAPSVSPTTATALLYCHTNSGSGLNGAPYTPPSGMTEIYDVSAGGTFSYSGATLQLSASGATGTKTFTTTTNRPWGAVSIAILAAAGGTTASGKAPLTVGAVRPPRTGSTLIIGSQSPSADHQPPAAFAGTPTRPPFPSGSALILGSRAPSPDFQQPPDVITAGRYPVSAGSAVVLSSRADPVVPTDSQPRPLVVAPLRPGRPGSALTVSSTAPSIDTQPPPLVIAAGLRPPQTGAAVVSRALASPPAPPTLAPVTVGSFTIPRLRPAGVVLLARMASDFVTCTTDRPFTGTTTPPNTGSTAYALATTARPNTGTTARPDTGTTEDPC